MAMLLMDLTPQGSSLPLDGNGGPKWDCLAQHALLLGRRPYAFFTTLLFY